MGMLPHDTYTCCGNIGLTRTGYSGLPYDTWGEPQVASGNQNHIVFLHVPKVFGNFGRLREVSFALSLQQRSGTCIAQPGDLTPTRLK